MYQALDKRDVNLINKIQNNITYTDYELKGNFIPVNSYMSIIEDLMSEIEMLEEKYNQLERELEVTISNPYEFTIRNWSIVLF